MPRPCRASIFAMVGSKLTINAQPPESVRVRLDLRWLGSRPGRVSVNTPERFNPESVPPPDSTLPLDAAARVVDQGPPPVALAHRQAPRHRGGRRPGLTALPPPGAPRIHLESSSNRPRRFRPPSPPDALVPRPARRHRGGRPPGLTALPPPGAPRIHLEPSPNRPRTVPEGSGQLPRRIRPPSPPVALASRKAPRHRGGRRPRLTALPPPGAPRTHLESSSKHPASVPQRSNHAQAARRTPVWPPPGRPKPASADPPLPGSSLGQMCASIPGWSQSAAKSAHAWCAGLVAASSSPAKPISAVAWRVATSARKRPKENQQAHDPKAHSLTADAIEHGFARFGPVRPDPCLGPTTAPSSRRFG